MGVAVNRLPSVIGGQMIGREGEGEEELLHVLLERMYLTVVNVVNEENEGGGGGDAKEEQMERNAAFVLFLCFFPLALLSFLYIYGRL